MSSELEELINIKKLLVAFLLKRGTDANIVAEILGYRDHTSISKMVPVRALQKDGKNDTRSIRHKVKPK